MIHQEILEKIDSLPISKKLKDIFKKTLEKNIKDKNGNSFVIPMDQIYSFESIRAMNLKAYTP